MLKQNCRISFSAKSHTNWSLNLCILLELLQRLRNYKVIVLLHNSTINSAAVSPGVCFRYANQQRFAVSNDYDYDLGFMRLCSKIFVFYFSLLQVGMVDTLDIEYHSELKCIVSIGAWNSLSTHWKEHYEIIQSSLDKTRIRCRITQFERD